MPADRAQSKRKPRPSLRARENRAPTHSDTPPTSRSRNRLPPAVEEVDLTSDMPVDLESNTKVSKRALKPQESSPTKYLLSFEVLVDNTRVGGRSWLQTAGEFDFAGFSRDEAQKTSDYCIRIGGDINSRSSIAGVTYNKKLAHESDLDGLADWAAFDELVGSFLEDKSKRDVQI